MLKWPKYSTVTLLVCIAVGAFIYYVAPSVVIRIPLSGNDVAMGFFLAVMTFAFWFVWHVPSK